MGTTIVDIPATTVRMINADSGPSADYFTNDLGDINSPGDIALTGGTLAPGTSFFIVQWGDQPFDGSFTLPDPPAGATLIGAFYTAIAYGPSGEVQSGFAPTAFGTLPEPETSPFLQANAGSPIVIDHLSVDSFGDVIAGRGVQDLADLADGTFADAWTVGAWDGSAAYDVHLHLGYFGMRLVYDDGSTDLPCDTDVALDLSTAVFLDNSGTLSGQYLDGVICTTTDFLQPDFYIPGLTVDPSSVYRITFTYDPDSSHDGGQREAYVSGLRPGHEQDDVDTAYGAGDEYSDIAVWWDTGFATTGDVLTFTVGPGRGPGPVADDVAGIVSWDDATYGPAAGYTAPWFESSAGAALSGITIRKLCTFVVPPLRHYPRSDALGASSVRRLYPPPPTIQASNRRGPSAIL